MKSLKITQFGNPLLRKVAVNLTEQQILSSKTKALISSMQKLLKTKKLGVGLAAPQVGKSLSLAIIELQETGTRKNIEELSLVTINPKIIKTFGNKTQLWEGCISSGEGQAGIFAKVPRYKKIELEYYDEKAAKHTETFSGLAAHVIQHEVDHLNGVLFFDKVTDTKSYMTYSEYVKMKRIKKA